MEKRRNNPFYINGIIHNKYIVEIKRNGETTKKAIGYNKADSKAYLNVGYIDRLVALGNGGTRLTKYIEPYPENNQDKTPDNEDYDFTDYWDRADLPTVTSDKKFVSSYTTRVYFRPEEPGTGRYGTGGSISSVELYGGGSLISHADLKDIENEPILLDYDISETVVITVYIYFIAQLKIEELNSKLYTEVYPVKWFEPGYSILGGSSGGYCGQVSSNFSAATELLSKTRRNHNDENIDDGYLPMPNINYYAISKAPVPRANSKTGFLMGGVNDYQIINPTEIKNGNKKYKNQSATGIGVSSMKGLIRSLVLPGLGLMDAKEITGKNIGGGSSEGYHGVFKQGIFQQNNVVLGNRLCYIPEDCVEGGDSKFRENLISMKKGALNGDDIKIRVRRYLTREVGNQTEMETIGDYVPLNEPFFSDISSDARIRRRMGFSQHVPLTENEYCGVESVIPCLPSAGWVTDSALKTYGYYIVYMSGDTSSVYLKANYIVPGQIVTVNANTGNRDKVTFPCELQYSYDGNEFFTATKITHDTTPFVPKFFGTIVAPIWRLIGGEHARNVMAAHNTTHSDPMVSKAAGVNDNGYDPYFLFVGYDIYGGNPEGEWSQKVLTQKIEEDNSRAIQNIPNQNVEKDKIRIKEPHNFRFYHMGYSYYPDVKSANIFTTVPYNCHPNDAVYLCGEIPYYSGGEVNDG